VGRELPGDDIVEDDLEAISWAWVMAAANRLMVVLLPWVIAVAAIIILLVADRRTSCCTSMCVCTASGELSRVMTTTKAWNWVRGTYVSKASLWKIMINIIMYMEQSLHQIGPHFPPRSACIISWQKGYYSSGSPIVGELKCREDDDQQEGEIAENGGCEHCGG